jgi:hypothetical protein
MRPYRGPERWYRPEEVRSRLKDTGNGTDFSDCPFTALSYAVGRNGVVLVLDVPDEAGLSVTEETWFVDSAKRLMVWGAFDRWLVAVIPAKELRAEVRRKGIAGLPPADKGEILRMAIGDRLAGSDAVPRRRLALFASGGLALSTDEQGGLSDGPLRHVRP